MKRNYIIPSTQSVVFYAGNICQAASPFAGPNVNVTGPNVGLGGGAQDIGNPD